MALVHDLLQVARVGGIPELRDFRRHIDPAWMEEALQATGYGDHATSSVAGRAGRVAGDRHGADARPADYRRGGGARVVPAESRT